MKKLLPLFLFVIFAGLFTSAALSTSKNKGWSKKEQKEFMKNCTSELKGQKSINAKGYCSCMLDKVMEKYPNPEDARKIDQEWMKDEALKCLSVTSDNFKAPWSESEQSNFMNSCVSEAKKNSSINPKEYCSCMLNKVMIKYPDPSEVGDVDKEWMQKEAASCIQKASK